MMKWLTIFLLVVAGLIFACWAICQYRNYQPGPEGAIHFSSKQVSVLTDLAKTLIPIIVGFAVLATSGAGFLHKHSEQLTSPQSTRYLIFAVYCLLVISLGGWIHAIESMVDCAAVFERLDATIAEKMTPQRIDFLNHAWEKGATSARAGTVFLFEAIDVTLMIAVLLFGDRFQP